MNILFSALFLASALIFLFNDPEGFLPAMLAGGQKASSVCLALLASYCVWMGFFRALERCGLSDKLSAALFPAARKLFRSQDREAVSLACRNLAANLLGLPGAPTPLGAAATGRFLNGGNGYAADMLLVLNCAGLQLLPSTAIALRAAAGSASPADILPPVLLSCLLSAVLGALLVALTRRRA